MAQLKDLLVNGKSKFLDIMTAVGMKLSTGGSDTTFWNTNGGVKTASEIVSAAGSFVTTNTTQTITGQKLFNTNTNTVPLLIGRNPDTTNQLLQIGVDDGVARFKHIQDETNASYEFVGQWTDTEGGGGAAAGSKSITFNLGNTDHSILVGSNTVLHTGNYSNYALPLAGGTMSNTNLVTNLNADLLDGQHGSYYMPANKKYWANVELGTSASTTTEPTFKTATIQNDTSHKCVMSYDSTEECMKFSFS